MTSNTPTTKKTTAQSQAQAQNKTVATVDSHSNPSASSASEKKGVSAPNGIQKEAKTINDSGAIYKPKYHDSLSRVNNFSIIESTLRGNYILYFLLSTLSTFSLLYFSLYLSLSLSLSLFYMIITCQHMYELTHI
jgi:hypothetical protein